MRIMSKATITIKKLRRIIKEEVAQLDPWTVHQYLKGLPGRLKWRVVQRPCKQLYPADGIILQLNIGDTDCAECVEVTRFLEKLPYAVKTFEVPRDMFLRGEGLKGAKKFLYDAYHMWSARPDLGMEPPNVLVFVVPERARANADAFDKWHKMFEGVFDQREFVDYLLGAGKHSKRRWHLKLRFKSGVMCNQRKSPRKKRDRLA